MATQASMQFKMATQLEDLQIAEWPPEWADQEERVVGMEMGLALVMYAHVARFLPQPESTHCAT